MVDVVLTYNPYVKSSVLAVNGTTLNAEETQNFCGMPGSELSSWCYSFYEKLLNEYNDDMRISFFGILRDFEFLSDALKKFLETDSSASIVLDSSNVTDPQDRLNDLKVLFNKMQKESPFESLKSNDLKDLFEAATSSEFEMAVVATMSSGKSTLINSILGREILPARNEATTATIAKIYDIDKLDHFEADSYDENGALIEHCSPLTLKDMERMNDSGVERVEIRGDIPGVDSSDIHLVLTDTPGPNNSRTAEHEKHTMDLLNSDYKPMIIYVLNGTQLETNDDSTLLSSVAKLMNSGDRQSRDRFIFVLNKADAFDTGKGESVAKKIEDVKKYLSEKHGIKNPRIFPAASKLAKQIRQNKNDPASLSQQDQIEFMGYSGLFIRDSLRHFSDYAEFLSPNTTKLLKERLDKAKSSGDIDEQALIYSGIPSIELAITEYLTKYALPAKISEGVYSFKDKIDALNVEALEKEKLKNNEKQINKIKKDIAKIRETLKNGEKGKESERKIDSIDVSSDIKSALAKCAAEFNAGNQTFLNGYNSCHKMSVSDAKKELNKVNAHIKSNSAKFTSDVEKVLNIVLIKQAEGFVFEYKGYIEALIGSFEYETPQALLGDVATISVQSTMSEFTRTETVKVGDHWVENKNKHWYKPWTWFDESGHYVDDYEDKEFVYFVNFIEDRVLPAIVDFTKNVQKAANERSKAEVKEFKSFFKQKLADLQSAIDAKLNELEQKLADQDKINAMIEENKHNLEWLQKFKMELSNLLKV